jgi:hypothetical protein
MASNFQILTHKTRDSLHLKLYGDFDGSSAYELLNALMERSANFFQIFIDTNDLKTIYPFGRDVFKNNLGTFKKRSSNLVFIGENKHSLAPYG